MTKSEAAAKRYLRKIRALLPCSRKVRAGIMTQIRARLEGIFAEDPDMDYDRLRGRLGEPEDIAAAYVESTGTAEILRDLLVRRRIVTIVTAVAAAVLITWAAVVSWTIVKVNGWEKYYVEMGTVNAEDIAEYGGAQSR